MTRKRKHEPSTGMLRKRRYKPSTFFRKLEWADKDVLRTADKLGVRMFDIPDPINECKIRISMPGTAEGTSWGANVLGYGAYATVNMIVAAHVAGQKSQK